MVTYQQVDWVGPAIESVLAQDLGDLEVVVGDDGSTDGTLDVLHALAATDTRVRLLPFTQHTGSQKNFMRTLAACRAGYVQQLDGDDLFTGDEKLRIQADFLDEHVECASCFTASHEVDADGHRTSPARPPPGRRARYTLEDFAARNLAHSGSVMLRAALVPELPGWLAELPAVDWPLHVLHLQHGDAGYVDADLSAHRVHPGGIWSCLDSAGREALDRTTQGALLDHLEPASARRILSGVLRAALRRARRLAASGAGGPGGARDAAAARETRAWLAERDPGLGGRLRRLGLRMPR